MKSGLKDCSNPKIMDKVRFYTRPSNDGIEVCFSTTADFGCIFHAPSVSPTATNHAQGEQERPQGFPKPDQRELKAFWVWLETKQSKRNPAGRREALPDPRNHSRLRTTEVSAGEIQT